MQEKMSDVEFGLIVNGNPQEVQGIYFFIKFIHINIFLVNKIMENTNYYKYNEESTIIRWLFELLEEYEQDKRKIFLYFATGILIYNFILNIYF